ncbi:unnamed protein product, partial [Bubo scandiacus]
MNIFIRAETVTGLLMFTVYSPSVKECNLSLCRHRHVTDATKTKLELKFVSSLYLLAMESLLAAVVIISLVAMFFSECFVPAARLNRGTCQSVAGPLGFLLAALCENPKGRARHRLRRRG